MLESQVAFQATMRLECAVTSPPARAQLNVTRENTFAVAKVFEEVHRQKKDKIRAVAGLSLVLSSTSNFFEMS